MLQIFQDNFKKKETCVTIVSNNYKKQHKTTLVGWVDKVLTKKNIMLSFTFTWIWSLNFKAMEEKTSSGNLYTSINVSMEKGMITYEKNKTIMGITLCCSKVDQYNDNSVHYRS
jgi:hypothetical protein